MCWSLCGWWSCCTGLSFIMTGHHKPGLHICWVSARVGVCSFMASGSSLLLWVLYTGKKMVLIRTIHWKFFQNGSSKASMWKPTLKLLFVSVQEFQSPSIHTNDKASIKLMEKRNKECHKQSYFLFNIWIWTILHKMTK